MESSTFYQYDLFIATSMLQNGRKGGRKASCTRVCIYTFKKGRKKGKHQCQTLTTAVSSLTSPTSAAWTNDTSLKVDVTDTSTVCVMANGSNCGAICSWLDELPLFPLRTLPLDTMEPRDMLSNFSFTLPCLARVPKMRTIKPLKMGRRRGMVATVMTIFSSMDIQMT